MKPEPPIRFAHHCESSTKRAAALLTVGIDFASSTTGEANISNIYDDTQPYREGQPGHIAYILGVSRPDGVAAADLAACYDDKTAAAATQLDDLADLIEQAAPELGRELKRLIPFAVVAYLRAGFENRERIMDIWKKAKPMILIRRGDNAFTLVERHASAKVRARYNLD